MMAAKYAGPIGAGHGWAGHSGALHRRGLEMGEYAGSGLGFGCSCDFVERLI